MEKNKIWLSSPHMGGNEQNFINDAFENNWIAPLGPNVNGFEEDIKNYLFSNSVQESSWEHENGGSCCFKFWNGGTTSCFNFGWCKTWR